ncbi:MAG: Stk1 family PASTA domain-containing Ser/Thr kinase [Clostridia bacterium]|nr:Stk1 family PASTA domain-containing Ser/Thr kinase [Clostridia bacterium]
MIGRVLGGRYELLELIGTGGMSRVYKAKCKLLNRYVAVKVLKEEYHEDKEFIKRFYIESQAAASLSSPHIVSIYDVGEEQNVYYIVMEYVEGVTLKEVISENGVMAWNVALNFSLQILSALECAHKNGIVHRDIKPHNIIVTNDGVLKVTDFGIARAINGNETKKIDDAVVGSVHYISPEQAKGIMIDARSDLYSLGIVMYEMLTGKLPYNGENPVSVALMHLNSEPISIKELNLAVPNELVRIVQKSMQRDVLNRYQNAREMASDLNEFKKVENLSTKENEDAFLAETLEMVKIAQQERSRTLSLDGKTIDNTPASKEVEIVPKKQEIKQTKTGKESKIKLPAWWYQKEERTAVLAALGVSTAILVVMIVIFIRVFFPSFSFPSLFESKEYLLPNVVDKYIEDVLPMLEEEGLKVEITEVEDESLEDGLILKQHPSGNIMVKVRKTKVHLNVVKNDSDTNGLNVPKVVNKEYRQAIQELEKAGFSVRQMEEMSSDIPAGFVIRQSPAANKKAKKGTEVIIYVAKAEEQEEVFVPDFLGMTEEEATAKANELGLSVTFHKTEGNTNVGRITAQSIAKSTLVAKNTSIRLTLIVEDDAGTTDAPEVTASPTVTSVPTHTPVVTEEPTVTAEPVSSQSLTIDLPQNKDSVEVIIKKAGSEVYRKTHQTSEKRITVSVKGSGTQKVEITLDGQQFFSQNIKFN